MRFIIAAATLCVSVSAWADIVNLQPALAISRASISADLQPMMLDWKVGETANYNINMGFINGSMVMSVASIGADGVWLHQDIDLGFAGQQKVEILFDPNTGEVKKVIANGQEQQVPDASNQEIVEMKEDRITVPAGTFDAVYARIKDTQSGQESEAWINPSEIPMMGLLKQISPSQFGEVVVELTSFRNL